jgi:hypothetical protein
MVGPTRSPFVVPPPEANLEQVVQPSGAEGCRHEGIAAHTLTAKGS